jgi:Flp pilus assembly protein TadG
MTHVPTSESSPAWRFARDERGVSATEFALLLPLMVLLYLGGVELSQALSADRKVTLVARAVADLAAQSPSLSDDDMSNILAAATSVLSPYPVAKLTVTVSQVTIDGEGKATVAWSDSKNGAPRAAGSAVTLPAQLSVPNTAVIWGEAAFQHKPVFGYVITGTMTLGEQIFMRPRQSDSVARL